METFNPNTRQSLSTDIKVSRLRKSPPVRLLIGVLLAGVTLCVVAVPQASALSIGLMSGGNVWQEESQWDAMQKSGATVYRLMVRNTGGWEEQYDRAFRLAAERGITILPYLYNFYGGKAAKPEQFPFTEAVEDPPGSPWETWVYTVVHRYGANGDFWKTHPTVPYNPVPAWEVWNEPNLNPNNPGGASVQPKKYAQFLKRTAAAIQVAQKEKTPGVGVPVLFGGLISQGNMSVGQFLKEAKEGTTELGSSFNGLSLHPYAHRAGVSGVQANVNNARTELTSTFSSSKQLWITELGWTLNDEGEPGGLWVTEQQQSEYLSGSFNWIKSVAAEKNIQSIIYFMYKDCPGCNLKWANWTGLRRSDGTFRQAWYAFQEQTGAKAWPVFEWQIDNLGKPSWGSITSDPDISSWEYGRLDVFASGPNNELVHKWYDGNFSNWENLGGTLMSGPGAVSWGPNRIDVVGRAADNTVNHWSWNGSAWYLDNLGGSIISDPDISSWGYGRLDFFARSANNHLVHKWYDGNFSNWEDLGGTLMSGPGAVSWGPNRIDVVGRTPENEIAHWAYGFVLPP